MSSEAYVVKRILRLNTYYLNEYLTSIYLNEHSLFHILHRENIKVVGKGWCSVFNGHIHFQVPWVLKGIEKSMTTWCMNCLSLMIIIMIYVIGVAEDLRSTVSVTHLQACCRGFWVPPDAADAERLSSGFYCTALWSKCRLSVRVNGAHESTCCGSHLEVDNNKSKSLWTP